MDIKKWMRDRINELDREKERLHKEQEKETAKKENDIQAKYAQADILDKFIKRTVMPCFEKAQKDYQAPDFLCEIDTFPDKQGRLYAIKINFSLVNHNKLFYLKYEGKVGNDEVKREICLADPSSPSRHGFDIKHLSPEIINKHIKAFLKAALPKSS